MVGKICEKVGHEPAVKERVMDGETKRNVTVQVYE